MNALIDHISYFLRTKNIAILKISLYSVIGYFPCCTFHYRLCLYHILLTQPLQA